MLSFATSRSYGSGCSTPCCCGLASERTGQPSSNSKGMTLMGETPGSRSFIKAAVLPFRRYARFAGRSSRMEFWSYTIVASALQIIVAVAATPFSWPLCLALFFPSLAVLVRRLHDVDRSGWWAAPLPVLSFALLFMYALTSVMLGDEVGKQILIAAGLSLLTILVLGTTLLVWTCRRGTPTQNRFGLPPQTTLD